MARILGIDIPNNKRIVIALTYVFGIGKPRSIRILKEAGIDKNIRAKDLTEEQIANIRTIASKHMLEGDLRRDIAMNIKRKMEISCYAGIRHRRGLSVRGQRTKTNCRTRKGPRKTVANKKMESR